MMYGSMCLVINKKKELKMKVAVIRILKWTRGVTNFDRIRNECTRGTLGVTNKSRKMRDNRLTWFEHVENREIVKKIGDIRVEGNRGTGVG